MLKDHIKEHNLYYTGKYYIKPERLEDLLSTEYYDVILATLKELAEKRREFNREFNERFKPRPMISKGCSWMYNM